MEMAEETIVAACTDPCDDGIACTSGDACVGVDNCTGGLVCNLQTGQCDVPLGCGNGQLDSGEQCDDGNNENGDCCSFTCQYEAAGSACPDDGNVCTDNECDGAGSCIGNPNSDPCDDGLFCNGADTCSGGSCSEHVGDPCAGEGCNEVTDTCDECQTGADCFDDNICTSDVCNAGTCENNPIDLGQTTCGVGECEVTVDNCVGGVPQTCTPGTPSSEVCDGLDNNCNGTADDGLGQTTCGLGPCEHTVDNCVGGVPQVCDPFQGASVETCNGVDDNCDDTIDEGNPGGGGSCSTGLPGLCDAGTITCSGGNLVCVADFSSTPEVCDGEDNNCNGSIDEGLGQTTCGVGGCEVTRGLRRWCG
jgi:hypothetical protein